MQDERDRAHNAEEYSYFAAPFNPVHDEHGYWHELTDRTHCAQVFIEELITTHPCAAHPAVKDKVVALLDAVAELYHAAGQEFFKKETE